MFVDNETKLDYSDVLLVPRESNLSSRSQIDLEIDHFEIPVVPIIAANMDGVGTFEMARQLGKHKIMTALTKHHSLDELIEFFSENASDYAIYSMGVSDADWKKFVKFDRECDGLGVRHPIAISIDVANGYSSVVLNFVERMREEYPDYILMVGNVVTPERTESLINAGADIVKIGLGSGSVCTTRLMTGVGYPQFSAVMECAVAADAAGGSICADGGITCSGDMMKAFGAGANYIMAGGIFAGHKEGIAEDQLGALKYDAVMRDYGVPFYGMASKEAQEKHNGGLADYRASEGKYVEVPFKGIVTDTASRILGGLRSGCTYIGASGIADIHKRAKFIRVNNQVNRMFS